MLTDGRLAWLAYLVGAGWFLLNPRPGDAASGVRSVTEMMSSLFAVNVPGRLTEFVMNALVFAPFPAIALLDPKRRWSPWGAAGLGLGISVAVEAAQGLFLSHRSAELVDVLANGLGASERSWHAAGARSRKCRRLPYDAVGSTPSRTQ